MNPQELANMTMQFMNRVQLSGQEVPAFTATMNWLDSFNQQPTVDYNVPEGTTE